MLCSNDGCTYIWPVHTHIGYPSAQFIFIITVHPLGYSNTTRSSMQFTNPISSGKMVMLCPILRKVQVITFSQLQCIWLRMRYYTGRSKAEVFRC